MRFEEWKPKSKIKIKIDEVLKNSMKRKSIEKSIKRKNEKRQKNENKNENKKKKKKSIKIFVIIQTNNVIEFFTIDFVFNYFFRSSWILNHDFDVHVVNKTMKQRFIKKRNCTNEFVLMLKMKSFFILIYDRMNINVNTFTKNMNMNFRNVSYVSDFMINIVANSIFADKKLHFDTTHDHLHRNDILVVFVFKIKTHYVFENNKKFEEMSNFAIIVRKSTTTKWHQLLTHVNNDVIQHLQQIVEKMKFINKNKMFSINKCEKCVFFKTHKIVFKSSKKFETSNKFFYRIIYDFIDMTTTLNKHKWISHVTCFETNFHMIYTHKNKKSTIEILIKIIHIIETKYEKKVIFVRSNDERSLSNVWNIYCVFKNISFELSTVDTSAQNDHIERLNVILLTKSRIMKFEINLFVYL